MSETRRPVTRSLCGGRTGPQPIYRLTPIFSSVEKLFQWHNVILSFYDRADFSFRRVVTIHCYTSCNGDAFNRGI